ncbi:MAG TPA: SpoIIE family protein phosphatase [Thermoguttaceae bacterium]|nr:SpoIIE family protein phosphatase [Thermoguttaceae bacterium]
MESKKVRILLVEDDPDDVWIMRNLLSDRWDGPFELVHTELLATGVTRCEHQKFDVILLDLALPDSRGLETFITMYGHADGVPIVVLSGYDDEVTAMKAVQAGAEDYLVKGQVTDNLLVRSIRYAIERNRRYTAEEALRDTSEEFRAAQEIQQRLFPKEAPAIDGFDIAGASYPAKATAGDYFDYIKMLDECLGVVVGDVSGHGMGPALLMSETRACLRTLTQAYFDVGDILTRANQVLAADTGDSLFVTLALARLNPLKRTLVYASCGQQGYLLGCDTYGDAATTVLESTSQPLGIDIDMIVPKAPPLNLQSGEIITFFTDGVFEAESPGRVRFGAKRALEVIRSERERPAREIVDAVYQEIAGFSRYRQQRDDITIVIVKVE